ncbi:MAG: hypothetical protein CMJ94_10710 [Planctomycetes bacterium]|nr:hypothetical protein [Planctomycetota bacterium]
MFRALQLYLGLLQLIHLLGLIYVIVELDALRPSASLSGRLWAVLPVSHFGSMVAATAMWRGKSIAYIWLSVFAAMLFVVYTQLDSVAWMGWSALVSWVLLSYLRVRTASTFR